MEKRLVEENTELKQILESDELALNEANEIIAEQKAEGILQGYEQARSMNCMSLKLSRKEIIKAICDGYEQGQADEQMKTKVIEHLEKENAELKTQIEKMKCCGNCKKMSEVFPSSVCDICNNKNNWELAE